MKQLEAPWGMSVECPNYDICNCCGAEAGCDDWNIAYRQQWLRRGAPWFEERERPANWNLEEQLKNIPIKFR